MCVRACSKTNQNNQMIGINFFVEREKSWKERVGGEWGEGREDGGKRGT